jgi:hypothetical protein
MRSFEERRKTRPIHIRLTKGLLALYAEAERRQKDLSSRCSLVADLTSFHQSLNALDKIAKEDIDAILVNVVHDEVIFEIPNDVRLGEHVSDLFCRSIEEVGRELNLKCPLAGDGHVGLNWYEIH